MDTDKHGFLNEVPYVWQVRPAAFGMPTVSVSIRVYPWFYS